MATTENTEAEFSGDVFDSMLYGSFEPEEIEGVDGEENADTAEDLPEDDEHEEDTDQEEESEDDEELDEAGDGELDEDSEDLDDDEEEDTLVEDNDLDDEDEGTEDDETKADEADEESDEDLDEVSEDEADTEESSDGEPLETGVVDYKAFYDAVVNTEFKVNGKNVKGFTDPQKIIQAQQMAGGFSEKMAGFKQYRPYMAPLKERGMLEDQGKFDLAMSLIDGDKEAIKKHLQSLSIDPLDLDMEQIDYSAKSAVASTESLIIEDVMERAKSAGIEDKVRQVIGNEWDATSFQEFTSNESVRNDLLSHMESGAYDNVQDKIAEMKRLDYNGSFGNMNTISQYRTAVGELQKDAIANPVVTPKPQVTPKVKASSVKSEKAKIEKSRQAEEYKEKATKREAKVAQQRKRAASMSKKKAKAKPKAKFDPMKVEGEEFDALMDSLIAGGRG